MRAFCRGTTGKYAPSFYRRNYLSHPLPGAVTSRSFSLEPRSSSCNIHFAFGGSRSLGGGGTRCSGRRGGQRREKLDVRIPGRRDVEPSGVYNRPRRESRKAAARGSVNRPLFWSALKAGRRALSLTQTGGGRRAGAPPAGATAESRPSAAGQGAAESVS